MLCSRKDGRLSLACSIVCSTCYSTPWDQDAVVVEQSALAGLRVDVSKHQLQEGHLGAAGLEKETAVVPQPIDELVQRLRTEFDALCLQGAHLG